MADFVSANGIRMRYRVEGPRRAPVVMLSNSLLTDYGMWDPQIASLAADFRVLRYDTRGHGETQSTPGPYSMEMLAADVVALLDALEIARVHFVGLSMGGMIAQRLAAKCADRLLSVVLCDTACQMLPASAWDERIAMAQAKGTAAFIGPMTTRWLTEGFRNAHADVVKQLGAMIAKTSVDGMTGCCQAIKAMDHLALLREIRLPTLIIVGEHDVGTPVSAAQVLHREIGGSRLAVIENAAHLPNIEQAEIFNRTLSGFLRSV